MKKIRLELYLIGSMDGRKEPEVKKERKYIRNLLIDTFTGSCYDLNIRDPFLKEMSKPGSILGIRNCGLKPKDVFEMDLNDVELADVLYWSTADSISEGSEVEFAGGGWFNRFIKKKYFKKQRKPKLMIMIGTKRCSKRLYKFQNMWPGVNIFKNHKLAAQFLTKYYKIRGGTNAIYSSKRKNKKIKRRK